MPGQAPVRQRPLSGELLASSDEGAWLPDPIAYQASKERGGYEADEARLFGWDELLGTWVEHLLTAIDIAVLGERVPTLLVLADRNAAKSRDQIDALRRFKRGAGDHARVFVLYLHEFQWLFQAWEIEDLPTLLFFGTDGAQSRAVVAGPLSAEEVVTSFRKVAVDFSKLTFEPVEELHGFAAWRSWLLSQLPGGKGRRTAAAGAAAVSR